MIEMVIFFLIICQNISFLRVGFMFCENVSNKDTLLTAPLIIPFSDEG